MQHTAFQAKAQHDGRQPIDAVLPRLLGVKQTAPGRWSARCPAHDDRGPSLSIREESDGKVLLHCFAGDTLMAVVAALGIQVRDLYPKAAEVRPMRSRGPVDLDRAVKDELQRILDREQQDLGYRPPTLSRHVAEARSRVGKLLMRKMPPTPVRWWEVEPHALDPMWRMLVLRAIQERAWRCNVPVRLLRDQAAANADVADAILADAAVRLRVVAV